MACGMAGMDEEVFWHCELREIFNRINGFQALESARQRERWEQARWQSAVFVNLNLPKGKKAKLQDLAVFPWEDGYKPNALKVAYTEEEREARFRKMDEFMKKKAAKNG